VLSTTASCFFAVKQHRALESRVRENRLHGSEGGAANDRPYPYQELKDCRSIESRSLNFFTASQTGGLGDAEVRGTGTPVVPHLRRSWL
jgi:hypothetical protein